jgi:LysR family transcriptional regulator, hydrogen peroxide-inducible genes activator
MDRPTVRQLECVVAVADHGSFRAAAASVGVTQPALSAQVALLEQALGVQIFERDRRRVLVTPAGAAIVARARAALHSIDGVVESARTAGQPLAGPLRVGIIPTVAPYLLPRVLPTVRQRFPQLLLVLREDQTARVLDELEAGRLDAVVLALPVPGDVTAAPLFDEEFLLAVPRGHALAGRRRVREDELDGEEVLLLEDGHCLRDQALAVCRGAGATEAVQMRATSLPTLVQMVAGGLGLTLLPEMAAPVLAPSLASGVATVRFVQPAPARTVGLVWRTSSARLREFRSLAEVMSEAAEKHLATLRKPKGSGKLRAA